MWKARASSSSSAGTSVARTMMALVVAMLARKALAREMAMEEEMPQAKVRAKPLARMEGPAMGPSPPKGKGKAQQDNDDDGDWTQVVRKTAGEWQLRATDWSDPLVSYDDLVAKATGDGDLVRAIAVLNEEQKETVLSLYRGSGKAHALLIVELKQSPDAERCPGAIGGRLVFRQATYEGKAGQKVAVVALGHDLRAR